MRKKSIAILFIFIWLIQISSSFVILSGTQYLIQKRNQNISELERIHKKNETFYFTSIDEINWTKEGKEFDRGGDLFDILSIEKVPGGVKIVCFKDQRDKLLAEMIKREQSDSKGSMLKQNFKQKIIINSFSIHVPPIAKSVGPLSLFIMADFSEPLIEVQSPPPWLYS